MANKKKPNKNSKKSNQPEIVVKGKNKKKN